MDTLALFAKQNLHDYPPRMAKYMLTLTDFASFQEKLFGTPYLETVLKNHSGSKKQDESLQVSLEALDELTKLPFSGTQSARNFFKRGKDPEKHAGFRGGKDFEGPTDQWLATIQSTIGPQLV